MTYDSSAYHAALVNLSPNQADGLSVDPLDTFVPRTPEMSLPIHMMGGLGGLGRGSMDPLDAPTPDMHQEAVSDGGLDYSPDDDPDKIIRLTESHAEWDRRMMRPPVDIVSRPGRATIYFVDTSHLVNLVTLFLYNHIDGAGALQLERRQVSELNFLSHLIFKLYRTPDGENVVLMQLSTGASHNPFQAVGPDHALPIDSPVTIFDRVPLDALRDTHSRLVHNLRSSRELDGAGETLKGVVAVYRHGDRTPKQKVKVSTTHPDVIAFIGDVKHDIVLKAEFSPDWFINFMTLIEDALDDPFGPAGKERAGLQAILDACRAGFDGLKMQAKDKSKNGEQRVMLICKWGGALTRAGRHQAKKMGQLLGKAILPSDPVKRRQFLDHAKVYTNNERRVHRSALSFTQALFAPEPMPDSIVQENPLLIEQPRRLGSMLDDAKATLHDFLINPPALDECQNMEAAYAELADRFSHELLDFLKCHPRPDILLETVHTAIAALVEELKASLPDIGGETEVGPHETLRMMIGRWTKVRDELQDPNTGELNASKIPDIMDGVKYDALHTCRTSTTQRYTPAVQAVYTAVRDLAQTVIPHEHGTTDDAKRDIAKYSTGPLMHKLVRTAENMMFEATPSLRLYFTSESHLHGLLNLVLLSDTEGLLLNRTEITELDYFTHLIFKVYESADSTFRIEVFFSSGATHDPFRAGDGVSQADRAPEDAAGYRLERVLEINHGGCLLSVTGSTETRGLVY